MNFLCFGILSFHCIDYFTCIVPERWDIVQVMQFLQIDLPKFRFTELGSKLAIQFNNNMHNFNKCQNDYVPVFHKLINMVNYSVSFPLSVSIYTRMWIISLSRTTSFVLQCWVSWLPASFMEWNKRRISAGTSGSPSSPCSFCPLTSLSGLWHSTCAGATSWCRSNWKLWLERECRRDTKD